MKTEAQNQHQDSSVADTSLLNRTLTSSESGSSSSDDISRVSTPDQTLDSDDLEAGKIGISRVSN